MSPGKSWFENSFSYTIQSYKHMGTVDYSDLEMTFRDFSVIQCWLMPSNKSNKEKDVIVGI